MKKAKGSKVEKKNATEKKPVPKPLAKGSKVTDDVLRLLA